MAGGRRGPRLAARLRHGRDHLARRLHHPRALPRPHQGGLRPRPGARQPAARPLLRELIGERPGEPARGGRGRRPPRRRRRRRSASALAYFDGYRAARLPANLIQAQRDYFGAHTYERIDRPGSVHSDWAASRPRCRADGDRADGGERHRQDHGRRAAGAGARRRVRRGRRLPSAGQRREDAPAACRSTTPTASPGSRR